MGILTGILRAVFDGLLLPFRGMPAAVGLAVAAALVSVVALLAYKGASNQKKIALVKRKIFAALFEIRLFNDDARAIFRAQGDILRHNAVYFALSLAPLAVMLPPMILVMAQLEFHYGFKGLEPGQSTVFEVTLKEPPATVAARESGAPVSIEVPPGLRLETPGVWIPAKGEIAWRIAAVQPGDHVVTVKVEGEEPVTKSVHVGGGIVRRSPSRLEAGFVNQLLYPAEAPLPKGSALSKIEVKYPGAEVSLFGWKSYWMIGFFVLTIVFGFALKGVFKVDF